MQANFANSERMRGSAVYLPRNDKLKSFARSLRTGATKEENHLWYDYLKNYPLQFHKQRIIGNYIADFYCPKVKLVVELDGSQHYKCDEIQYDKERTKYFNFLGITVIRFTNLDIHDRFEGVCISINKKVKELYMTDLSSVTKKKPSP